MMSMKKRFQERKEGSKSEKKVPRAKRYDNEDGRRLEGNKREEKRRNMRATEKQN